MVECIKFNPELRYTQDELSAVLPHIPEESVPSRNNEDYSPPRGFGTQLGLLLVGRRCEFIKFCKHLAKSLSEPLWYAKITNLAVFKGGLEAIHSISKPYPNYSYEETQRKIERFYKSGTKPMTCQAIAERGFDCPKRASCKCKSPAGQAFFPMKI
jgi:putative DNA primase/helicase